MPNCAAWVKTVGPTKYKKHIILPTDSVTLLHTWKLWLARVRRSLNPEMVKTQLGTVTRMNLTGLRTEQRCQLDLQWSKIPVVHFVSLWVDL